MTITLAHGPVAPRLDAPRRPGATTRVAALDLGSNSFHLAVADLAPDGHIRLVASAKEKVQLGRSVFATGRVSEEAFGRGLAALGRLHSVARAHGAETIVVVATSALRHADNGREFTRWAARITGLEIRVIQGEEEASLVLEGVRASMRLDARRLVLFDVGGGSTEVVVSDAGRIRLSASLELGTLRAGRHLEAHDPPTARALGTLARDAAAILDPTLNLARAAGFDQVVLSCGAARRLWRVARPGRGSDAVVPAGGAARLALHELRDLERRLSALPEARRIELGETAGASDTLLPGCVLLRVLLEGLGAREALVSTTGLREGLIVEQARGRSTRAS